MKQRERAIRICGNGPFIRFLYKLGLSQGQTISRCRAFTLLELLVVIVIITLLTAIFLPALQKTRRHTRSVFCQANLRQWGIVFSLYTEDNQGRLPGSGRDALSLIRETTIRYEDVDKPSVYYDVWTRDFACCPMAVTPGKRGTFETAQGLGAGFFRIQGTSGSTFEAWEITSPAPSFRGSYGINSWLLDTNFDTSIPARHHVPWRGLDVFSLRNRAQIPALLDCKDPWERFVEDFRPALSSTGRGSCINRHKGYINGLFLDWSTKRIGLKELWTLKWNGQFNTENPWTVAGGVRPDDWPTWMRGFKDY